MEYICAKCLTRVVNPISWSGEKYHPNCFITLIREQTEKEHDHLLDGQESLSESKGWWSSRLRWFASSAVRRWPKFTSTWPCSSRRSTTSALHVSRGWCVTSSEICSDYTLFPETSQCFVLNHLNTGDSYKGRLTTPLSHSFYIRYPYLPFIYHLVSLTPTPSLDIGSITMVVGTILGWLSLSAEPNATVLTVSPDAFFLLGSGY